MSSLLSTNCPSQQTPWEGRKGREVSERRRGWLGESGWERVVGREWLGEGGWERVVGRGWSGEGGWERVVGGRKVRKERRKGAGW